MCVRAEQRWLVMDTVRVRGLMRLDNPDYSPQFLSLVPEFGRIPVGSLNAFEIDKFLDFVAVALKACGIDHYKLGLDISLNQTSGVASPGFWQLQLWGFFDEPKTPWHEHLKALVDPNRAVTNPVQVKKRDYLEAAAAYGLKSKFNRRVGYQKANLNREDRGACANTRDRILRGDPWVELMLFLDRIGLERRLLLSTINLSAPPLHSRNDSRLGGTK
jgi:hypothetical protein